jgi:hypothetical protein
MKVMRPGLFSAVLAELDMKIFIWSIGYIDPYLV